MKINEIFYSLQGEGLLVGTPSVFIRTSGCNLRCTYCDTIYAYEKGTEMMIQEIIDDGEEISMQSDLHHRRRTTRAERDSTTYLISAKEKL